MAAVMTMLVIVPLVAVVFSAVPGFRIRAWATIISALLCLAMSIALVVPVTRHTETIGFLRADALSVVFLLGATFLYAATSVYALGYLPAEYGGPDHDDPSFDSVSRRFYLGFNAFAWSLICAPLVNGLALLWVAVEVTTVVSALLVALEASEQASEAAWKYVLIASSGLGIGLLATIFMYFAGAQVLGQSYDLAFDPLIKVAAVLPPTPVRLAFVLAVVGYGTKVGLFPVHTWLPDAHAEAPTPVSALLSGSLLATSFYAILRYHQIAVVTIGPRFPQLVLLVFGVLSLLVAASYLLDQRNLKRMLAYSSIEHMGILAIAVSFGAPLALAGALLHVLAHAAAKGNAFMAAGVIVQRYRTKELVRIRDVLRRLPWTGPLFAMAVLALSAMPPFGLFRSEFQIVAGGLAASKMTGAALLVVLVTVAFAGLMISTTRMLFLPSTFPSNASAAEHRRGREAETSGAMVIPLVFGVLVLVMLGVHPIPALTDLITAGAHELGGNR